MGPGTRLTERLSRCLVPRPSCLTSHMYRRAMRGVSGLADGLRHRRMRVNRANQLFDRRLEAKRHGGFRHQLGRARSNHVHAKHLIVSASPPRSSRSPRPRPRSSPGPTRRTGTSRSRTGSRVRALPFGQPDAADLGIAIGAGRHLIVVNRRHVAAGDALGKRRCLRPMKGAPVADAGALRSGSRRQWLRSRARWFETDCRP